jgi:methylglutaconyl-CoA hydratase
MSFATIAVATGQRGVSTITLSRPERGNAIDGAMREELARAFDELAADAAARVIVLRGAGRHFCAGADVGGDGDRDRARGPGLPALLHQLDTLAKPTIAVLHGACLGGGVGFAVCCDVAIAADGTFFSLPEVRLGFPPGALMPYFLRAAGYRNFRRYVLSGERFGAADALRIGLVHEVAAAADIEDRLTAASDEMLQAAPGAIAIAKARAAQMVAQAADLIEGESAQREHMRSPEAIEGLAAFREKRKPNWYPPKG